MNRFSEAWESETGPAPRAPTNNLYAFHSSCLNYNDILSVFVYVRLSAFRCLFLYLDVASVLLY